MQEVKLFYELLCAKKRRTYTREKIEALQREKWKELVVYAFHHSAFYHRTFSEAGITDENIAQKEITEFPTIEKETFLRYFDQILTVKNVTQNELIAFDEKEQRKEVLFQNQYHLIHSSGSTGTPAFFLYDQQAWQSMLTGIIRAALWDMSSGEIIRLLVKKPRILYIAATDGRYGGALAVGDGIQGLHMKQLHLNVQSPIEEWIQQVKTFRPNIIIGYPSAVKVLTELMKNGEISLQLTRVITCGEPLSENLRHIFEQAFQCQVVNVYGASESLALGVGITGKKGIVLFDDLNLIEIEQGKIYLTCLYNFAQPLIRYQLSDELVLEENQTETMTTVKTILGRNEDLMWFQNEKGKPEFLHPLSVEGICVQGLRDYQFRKINPTHFEMLAEIEEQADHHKIKQEISLKMKEVLQAKKLDFVTYSIRFVDVIYPDQKTGKKKLILTEET